MPSVAAIKLSSTVCGVKPKSLYLQPRVLVRYSTAVLSFLCLFSTFMGWDGSGRSSYEILAVVERTGVLTDSVPVRVVLVWWVIQPVLLLYVILAFSGIVRAAWRFRHAAALLCMVTALFVSIFVKRAPGATAWVTATLITSVAGGVFALLSLAVDKKR